MGLLGWPYARRLARKSRKNNRELELALLLVVLSIANETPQPKDPTSNCLLYCISTASHSASAALAILANDSLANRFCNFLAIGKPSLTRGC